MYPINVLIVLLVLLSSKVIALKTQITAQEHSTKVILVKIANLAQVIVVIAC